MKKKEENIINIIMNDVIEHFGEVELEGGLV
jgi:hypothetical protein